MKNWRWQLIVLFLGGLLQACVSGGNDRSQTETMTSVDALQAKSAGTDSVQNVDVKVMMSGGHIRNSLDPVQNAAFDLPEHVNTKGVSPQAVVAYAKTLAGIPYKYASTNPSVGFDCSGFVTHVFGHFEIVVPRSSIDFTHVGKEIPAAQAKPGDIILFTGTNPKERFVGHMGIVIDNSDSLRFIHSSSGKANGVTITPLNDYYQGRYVKTIRIFPQNG